MDKKDQVTFKELVEMCRQKKIKGFSGKNKNELIKLLKSENDLSDLFSGLKIETSVETTPKIVETTPKIVETTDIELFWNKSKNDKKKLNQLERYQNKKSPECITNFIKIGGGPKMGVICEEFARHRFSVLKPRLKGKQQTGYDHIIVVETTPKIVEKIIKFEQKSSGHWGEDDFKWQHVEKKHCWDILLLCGIGYKEIKFWIMNRKTFNFLVSENKITNQGNKKEDSSEGMWFSYSDVKNHLIEINNNEQLIKQTRQQL